MESSSDFAANIERFTGFAAGYDQYRPAPPGLLAPLFAQIARQHRAGRVVDLGSGTGLSTRYWAGHASEVIGIEPTADMRRQAEGATTASNVHYREGFSDRTGVSDRWADLVCCSQALHWMDPQPTFQEVARILRPGGVFIAVDYDWPPTTPAWEADAAYQRCMTAVRSLEEQPGLTDGLRRWAKDGHFERMRTSGCFRYVKEIAVDHTDTGNAERLVGLLLSQGSVQTLLKHGYTETALGLDALREIAELTLGAAPAAWHWSARVRYGIV